MLYKCCRPVLLVITLHISGCGLLSESAPEKLLQSKVQFDLSRLDDAGLYGPYDGLRSVSYEFCIPTRNEYVDEVLKIDSSAVVYKTAKGRVGCGASEYLIIGNTLQEDYRAVLLDLAQKPYIHSIQQSFFE